jgi:REP element-mobilizing transposase RayT
MVENRMGCGYHGGMSRVRRLLVSDRIFFVTVNLRRSLPFLREEELTLVVEALAESRRRTEFLLCGYVVLPDHWHALIWPRPPVTISRAVQSVKWQAASQLAQPESWDAGNGVAASVLGPLRAA